MGKLFVIDGLDGSGKGTQSAKLTEYLIQKGVDARRISFPAYGTRGAALVEGYLDGELGGKPDDTGAYATSTFYAVDRYWSYRTRWGEFYNRPDTVIICDRYTTANAVHQCSKLPREQWDEYLDWLWDNEYNKLGIPRPDKICYLEMRPDLSRRLVEERSVKEGRKIDIHEKDYEYLDRCYEAALYASDYLGWEKITCYEGDEIRSVEDIFAELLTRLEL